MYKFLGLEKHMETIQEMLNDGYEEILAARKS